MHYDDNYKTIIWLNAIFMKQSENVNYLDWCQYLTDMGIYCFRNRYKIL